MAVTMRMSLISLSRSSSALGFRETAVAGF